MKKKMVDKQFDCYMDAEGFIWNPRIIYRAHKQMGEANASL